MPILAERWCELPASWRWGIWICCLLLMTFFTLHTSHSGIADSERPAFQALWRRVLPLQKAAKNSVSPVFLAFAATDFQTGGSSLIRWQPGNDGGELVLETDWKTVPVIFSLLATRGMAVRAFSVRPGTGALQMVMQLERIGNG